MSNESTVDRRAFVAGAATIGLATVSGCTNDPQQEDEQIDSPQGEGNRPADQGDEGETTTLEVTIESEEGDLVGGATVMVEGDENQYEQTTEPDGTALIDNIAPGQYSIEATADGHGTVRTGVDLQEGESEHLELTLPPAGEERRPGSQENEQNGT